MTILRPKEEWTDRLLRGMGKKRAVSVPVEFDRERLSGAYLQCIKESFWRALVRPAGKPPPTGWVYISDLNDALR